MADFTILPPQSDTNAYPAVLGQPSVNGPIIYPEQQPGDPENVVPFTRETGLDPSKIPSLAQLTQKKPALRMLNGGVTADPGAGGAVINAESEKTGGAPDKGLVITNTAEQKAIVRTLQDTTNTPAPPPGTVGDAQKPKAGMPWWQIALVAGGALLVGYSLAKRNSDEPLVADMEDEEADEEDEG